MTMRTPVCHPDKRHQGRGLCRSCYIKEWKKNNPERKRELNRRWSQNNREKELESSRRWVVNNPEKRRQSANGWYKRNAKQASNTARQWQRNNPDVVRKNHVLRKYGLTFGQYQLMMDEQGGKCPNCKVAPATHVDHDHRTGKVRGILCNSCNGLLGMAREDERILFSAIEYLRKHGAIPIPFEASNILKPDGEIVDVQLSLFD